MIDKLSRATMYMAVLSALCAVWFALAWSLGLYRIQPTGGLGLIYPADAVNRDAQGNLKECLASVGSRQMFKQSLLYRVQQKQVVDVLGDYIYSGMMGRGDSAKALIKNKKTSELSSLAVGETLGDLTVEEILKDRVILTHGEEKRELIR